MMAEGGGVVVVVVVVVRSPSVFVVFRSVRKQAVLGDVHVACRIRTVGNMYSDLSEYCI